MWTAKFINIMLFLTLSYYTLCPFNDWRICTEVTSLLSWYYILLITEESVLRSPLSFPGFGNLSSVSCLVWLETYQLYWSSQRTRFWFHWLYYCLLFILFIATLIFIFSFFTLGLIHSSLCSFFGGRWGHWGLSSFLISAFSAVIYPLTTPLEACNKFF